MNDNTAEQEYWENRWHNAETGWDLGSVSVPLRIYFNQLDNPDLRILIPGAGNGYEAEYLWKKGFKNVFVLDIAQPPLDALQKRTADFPADRLLRENFFEHTGEYDLIIEQTFFCSFEPYPENRLAYARKMHELLAPGGKLAGLWFRHPLVYPPEGTRPFGGSQEEYLSYFEPYFEVVSFDVCGNSIKPRRGNELFGLFKRSF